MSILKVEMPIFMIYKYWLDKVPIIGSSIFCLLVWGGAQLPHLYVTTLNVVICSNISYE
jgi:hypothetical protein